MKLQGNKKEERSHVIEKIKRISLAMDRGEFWMVILFVSLAGLAVAGLVYYMLL